MKIRYRLYRWQHNPLVAFWYASHVDQVLIGAAFGAGMAYLLMRAS